MHLNSLTGTSYQVRKGKTLSLFCSEKTQDMMKKSILEMLFEDGSPWGAVRGVMVGGLLRQNLQVSPPTA